MRTAMACIGACALAIAACGGSDSSSGSTDHTKNGTAGGGQGGGSSGAGASGSTSKSTGAGASQGTSTSGSGTSTAASSGAGAGSCSGMFPAPADPPVGESWWNVDVSSYPLDPNSDAYIAEIDANGGDGPLHADFDTDPHDGIPVNFVDGSVTKTSVTFDYADESDKGPYPIPPNPMIEGGANSGGDQHLLMVSLSECKLYELYNARQQGSGKWAAGAGAIWDLTSNAMRPNCWTSADAAGLPIYPGLVRYDEVKAGVIPHALRFTIDKSQKGWITPARHEAGDTTDASTPPMGLRFRLKNDAHVNSVIAGAGAQPKVVLQALQKYGMIVADNGSNWYVSGASDSHWDDDGFHAAFGQIHGTDFEVVKTGPIETEASAGCN